MTDPSYEEWLDEFPKRRELVKVLEQNNGGSLPQQFKEYLVNSSRRNAQQFFAIQNWIERSRGLCHRILAGVAPEAEYPMFWIHLHGLTEEVYQREDQNRATTMLIPWRRPFVESLDALRACFDNSELAFIRFMRHNRVHVYVDYPCKRMKSKDGKFVSVREASDPNAVANAELLLVRYENDQRAAAIDFVRKAIRAVDTVHDAFATATAI